MKHFLYIAIFSLFAISSTAYYFSGDYVDRSPAKRGIRVLSITCQKSTLQASFENTGTLFKGGYLMPHEALRSAIVTFKEEIDANPNYRAAFSIPGIPL